MARDSSPTVRRRRLVHELRKLRVAAGLSQEEVAERLDWSLSKQQKIELCRVSVSVNDVRAMLMLYGLSDPAAREPFVQLARDARKRGWWQPFGDVVPGWFETYVGLEAEASSLRRFSSHLVPGLFQTAEYARALMRSGFPGAGDAEIERRVEIRLTRQQLLERENPPTLWAILDEAVLHRVIGGPEVMAAQLRRVAKAAELPHVAVQVIPFTSGAYRGLEFPFSMFGFPEPQDPDVVFVEYRGGGLYLEKDEDLRLHSEIFEELRAISASPADSVTILHDAAAHYG